MHTPHVYLAPNHTPLARYILWSVCFYVPPPNTPLTIDWLSPGAADRPTVSPRAFTLNQSLGIAFSVGKVGAYCIRPTCTWRRIIHPSQSAFYGAYAFAHHSRIHLEQSIGYRPEPRIGILWFGGLSSGVAVRSQELQRAITRCRG